MTEKCEMIYRTEDELSKIVNERVKNIDNPEDLKKHYDSCKEPKENWRNYINDLVKYYGNKKGFAEECGVSRPTLDSWLNQGAFPRDRNTFIRIGYVAAHRKKAKSRLFHQNKEMYEYGLSDLNFLLTKIAFQYELNAKNSLEDFVYRYGLVREPKLTFEKCEELIEELSDLKKGFQETHIELTNKTGVLHKHQADIGKLNISHKEKEELLKSWFSNLKLDEFEKLYDRLNFYKDVNLKRKGYIKTTVYDFVNGDPKWQKIISAINKKKWIPRRGDLIDLAVRYNCDLKQLDELLALARMPKLSGKVPDEAVVMQVLNDAELNEMIKMDGSSTLYDKLKEMQSLVTFCSKLIVIDGENVFDIVLTSSKNYRYQLKRDIEGLRNINVSFKGVSVSQGEFFEKNDEWVYRDALDVENHMSIYDEKGMIFWDENGTVMKHGYRLGLGLKSEKHIEKAVLIQYLYDCKNELKIFPLEKEQYVVGNSFDCHLKVRDRRSESIFFELIKENGKWYVYNCGRKEHQLREKDVIFSNDYYFIYSKERLIYNEYRRIIRELGDGE